MSYDIDDAIYDVPLPGNNSTLEEFKAFERLQKTDPLNSAFSVVPRFKFILDEFAPSLGRLMERPEYRSNLDIQFKAMKLCFYGLGYKFDSTHPHPAFHVTELVEEVESVDPEFFLNRLVKFFRGGEYLLSRNSYCNSPLRLLKTMVLAMSGFGNRLIADSGNFDYELNRILREVSRHHEENGYDPCAYLDAMDRIRNSTDDAIEEEEYYSDTDNYNDSADYTDGDDGDDGEDD
jgi:hypothetical protein